MADNIISTAISLTRFILAWKEERKNAIADLKGLSTSVVAVQQVLEAFDISRGNHVLSALTALVDSLCEIKEILQAYEGKINKIAAFFFPAKVSNRVRRVEGDMLKFVQILSLGVSMSPVRIESSVVAAQPTATDFLQSETTKAFWKKNFGEKAFSVKSDAFVVALKKDYPDSVDERMLKDLLMRLDNFNTGNVSVCRVAEFVGDEDLRKHLDAYKFDVERNAADEAESAERAGGVDIDLTRGRGEESANIYKAGDGADVKLPLLVWVDDKPNHKEIDYVRGKGLNLVLLKSTAEAKEWVRANEELLDTASPSQVRIITNNVRQGADTALDINAGEEVVRFVRGRRHPTPILVYCGDLKYAQYVRKYEEVSAANTSKDFRAFADALHVFPIG